MTLDTPTTWGCLGLAPESCKTSHDAMPTPSHHASITAPSISLLPVPSTTQPPPPSDMISLQKCKVHENLYSLFIRQLKGLCSGISLARTENSTHQMYLNPLGIKQWRSRMLPLMKNDETSGSGLYYKVILSEQFTRLRIDSLCFYIKSLATNWKFIMLSGESHAI